MSCKHLPMKSPPPGVPVSPLSVRAVVRPPAPELLLIAEIIEHAIDQYLAALRSNSSFGQWEAPIEGWALGCLLIRNIEAVIGMAHHDEVLVTAAWSNTRVAFEQGVRILWMLEPDDRYQAECRWLAFLKEYEKFERDMAREVPADAELHTRRAVAVHDFRVGVASKLPRGYQPAKTPSFRDMLKAIDNPEMYRFYREGSQYVHGSMYGSGSYRHNLGTHIEVGEFTSTFDWILPMRLCWITFLKAASMILRRLDVAEAATPNWGEMAETANGAFQSLAYAAVARRDKKVDKGDT
jgi:hypothetical protein